MQAEKEENPGIIIEPDEWGYDVQTFLAKAEGGTLPDLYYTHFTEFDKIIDGEYAADIKSVLVKNDYYDKISDSMLKLIERDGKVIKGWKDESGNTAAQTGLTGSRTFTAEWGEMHPR